MYLNNKITYSAKHDCLVINVDDGPNDVNAYFEYESEDGILTLTFNKYSGGLMEVELRGLKTTFEDNAPTYMTYDTECDSLAIKLTDEDCNTGLCDMIYNDTDKHIMVTANRNKVGNLTGIEVCGLEVLIGSLVCANN
jgi:hypothetical protein